MLTVGKHLDFDCSGFLSFVFCLALGFLVGFAPGGQNGTQYHSTFAVVGLDSSAAQLLHDGETQNFIDSNICRIKLALGNDFWIFK